MCSALKVNTNIILQRLDGHERLYLTLHKNANSVAPDLSELHEVLRDRNLALKVYEEVERQSMSIT